MRRFAEIVRLELKAMSRSRAVAFLLVASVVWMFLLPMLVRGDGTAAGARELYIHYSLGGVFALLVVSLVSSATGAIARERETKRLQLTLVRPVRYTTIVLGKVFAHVAVGAAVLAVAAVILAFRTDVSVPCSHVLSPILPSPRDEARAMYEAYLADPDTPAEVKRAPKRTVLRLLENRAIDHYQTINTNSSVSWSFEAPKGEAGISVRMRFTNHYEMRQAVLGEFVFGSRFAAVSNVTQAVLTIPLAEGGRDSTAPGVLAFVNRGASSLMLRPRRDLDLLVTADAFGWNLLRAYFELVAILSFIVAFGAFLGSGLGRPVALFTAIVTLIVGEISPSVVEQYPDELDAKFADRIGLMITRFAAEVTHPVSSLSPLSALSKDECVELLQVVRTIALDCVAFPLLLALLAACAMPRKQDDQ